MLPVRAAAHCMVHTPSQVGCTVYGVWCMVYGIVTEWIMDMGMDIGMGIENGYGCEYGYVNVYVCYEESRISIDPPFVPLPSLSRQAGETDGKAQRNLQRLQQFRWFYVVTIGYVYFTRIAVYLLEASVPYYFTWGGAFCAEAAALAFYAHTGYVFRPVEAGGVGIG
ncbi:hypothetical protein EON64_16640, partial [archaeon]